jgi:prolyl-tRNA synthetase
MKQSRLFYKSLKTTPKEAASISHKLLLRGSFIEQIAAGRYAFLPLGYRVWEKIINVIDNEMKNLGSQRISTPTLHPIEIWQATNRDQAFGDEMLIVEDHHGSQFAIGATAEGLMTELVKSARPSYKNLPIIIHQFVQKFRDEKRPRGGLLRVREFMMKDAYSFHATEKDLLIWYDHFYQAYARLAQQFDLKATPVLADSGAIGGEYNHEFMVESLTGEDQILVCENCDYAANIQKAESKFQTFEQSAVLNPREDVKGVGVTGVKDLAKFLKIPVHVTSKTLIYKTDTGEIIAAMIRGDYDINETKLKNQLGILNIELADESTVKKITGAEVGYAGPIGLPKKVKLVADLTCRDRTNFEAGANKTNYHALNINFERDFPKPEFIDIRQVKDGDACPECGASLKLKKAIEWGHTFHQGQFYAGPHRATFTNQDGQQQILWQGAYGIGIGRTMATIVEVHHDKDGIIWPKSVTPFHVHLINLSKITTFADEVYQTCKKNGFAVLYDDRDLSAGEKFAEADLLGITVRLVVGDKNKNKIEWKERRDKNIKLLNKARLIDELKKYYND